MKFIVYLSMFIRPVHFGTAGNCFRASTTVRRSENVVLAFNWTLINTVNCVWKYKLVFYPNSNSGFVE